MIDVSINIDFDAYFGGLGSGNAQFNFPSGIIEIDSYLYIVDNQNHRVKKHDLAGNFVSQFGNYGTGTGNFSFPIDICTDGTYLYILDSGNNRVKKTTLDGVYVDQITGFSLPSAIWFDTNLFIADTQNNKVVEYTSAGAFVSEITGLNFPTGVTTIESQVVICDFDSVYYYEAGILRRTIDLQVWSVKAYNDVVFAIDNQNNSIHFLIYDETYSKVLFFPRGAVLVSDKLYVTDSNHRVNIFDFSVEDVAPTFTKKLLNLSKQLYPTGNAWIMKINSVFEKLHEGLALSESRALSAIRDLSNSVLPDNDDFSELDAFNWERCLALYQNPQLTLNERKTIIQRKMNFPNSVRNRGHYLFIQGELQKVGFDVYIYENRFKNEFSRDYFVIDPRSAVYNTFAYNGEKYGQTSILGDFTILANHVEEEKDRNFNIGNITNLRATFFVGGPVFGERAFVKASRLNEFREMLLRLKPAQTAAAFLLVDYVDETSFLELETSLGGIELEDGTGLLLLETA